MQFISMNIDEVDVKKWISHRAKRQILRVGQIGVNTSCEESYNLVQ